METANKKYIITMVASQEAGGEKDRTKFTAPGEFFEENGVKIVRYKEFSTESKTNDDYYLNTIKIFNDSKVSVAREGSHTTRLFLEKDKLHRCHFRTPMGDLMFDVMCTRLNDSLNDKGGELDVAYNLDINGHALSRNRFVITVLEQ